MIQDERHRFLIEPVCPDIFVCFYLLLIISSFSLWTFVFTKL